MPSTEPQTEAEFLEAFRVCRQEVHHEYGVLTGRLTTYITSQSFLVNAYAVAMNNANPATGITYRLMFPLLVCFAGFALTLQAYPGISGVCTLLDRWHDRQLELLDGCPALGKFTILDDRPLRTINNRALVFAKWSSWIFGIAWIVMMTIALQMHV